MLHLRRLSLLLAGVGLTLVSCQTIPFSVVNFVLLSRSTNINGNDRLDYVADLRNDSAADVSGAWSQVSGGVPAGTTVTDDILQFGPTPASGTSRSLDLFEVEVPAGAAFDPTVLTWAIHTGNHDADLDGMGDGQELDVGLGTDPSNPDTDGDGVGDGVEFVIRTDPKSAEDVPASFPSGLFYSTSLRANGDTALALPGLGTLYPGTLLLIGPGTSGPAGVAFDRHGFLYEARGSDIAHMDALTGQLLGSVPLHDSAGNALQATQLAYDPTRDVFVAVENDPATGGPTRQLLQVDVRTGLATPFGSPLPGTPRAITILPQIDSTQGSRWLYAVIDDGNGTQQVYQVDLGSGSASPVGSALLEPVSGLAFDQSLNLIEATSDGSGQSYLVPSISPDSPYNAPLGGLAIPRACPAPCFASPVYRGVYSDTIAVGDVDGDGDPDVVVGSFSPQSLDWYANDGSGNLVAQPATTVTDGVYNVALADLDGDGHLDAILAGGSHGLAWARGHGAGAFDPPVLVSSSMAYPVVVGDVDGNGTPDILLPKLVLLNDGTATFTGWDFPFGRPNAVAIAKFGPGVQRVVAVYGDGSTTPDEVATFAWGGPLTGFVETGRQALSLVPRYLAAGDLDGDGVDDLVVSGVDPQSGLGAVATLHAAADGTLGAPVLLRHVPTFLSFMAPLIADLTGDGRPDILLSSYSDPQRAVQVFVGDGAGHFQRALFDPIVSSNNTDNFAAVDLDGDGRKDLVGSFSLLSMKSLPVYPVK